LGTEKQSRQGGPTCLRNYQRHDYQKSWRVAGEAWRVKGGREQAKGQKSAGGADRSLLRRVSEGPWQQEFSGFPLARRFGSEELSAP
jgi:hypothetical protein